MIKVGDKLLIKGEVYIIQNESYNDNKVEAKCMSELKFVEMEFDTALGYAFAYEKQRADELEKHIRIMRDNYSEINKDAQTILRTAPDDVLLKAQIRWNNDVIKILDKILEDNNA